jgi:hypothetical protein
MHPGIAPLAMFAVASVVWVQRASSPLQLSTVDDEFTVAVHSASSAPLQLNTFTLFAFEFAVAVQSAPPIQTEAKVSASASARHSVSSAQA